MPINADPLPPDVFRTKLPTEPQTQLLRFCLWADADKSLAAWEAWRKREIDPRVLLKRGKASIRGVNNLLVKAFDRHGVSPGPGTMHTLRAQVLHDRLRSDIYQDILRKVLRQLVNGNVDFVLSKGAALSELAYPSPSDRHCHDIDILVPERGLKSAMALLRQIGFRNGNGPGSRGMETTMMLTHHCGLPVALHTTPFGSLSAANEAGGDFTASTLYVRILGESVKVPPPHLSIIQVACLAFLNRRRDNFRWISDIWYEIERRSPTDWDALLNKAAQCHTTAISHIMLGYLRDYLEAPVPDFVAAGLRHAAESSRYDRDVAYSYVWEESRMDFAAIVKLLGGYHLRLASLRWLLFPTLSWMRRRYPTAPRVVLPSLYVRRWLGMMLGVFQNGLLRARKKRTMRVQQPS